MFKSIKPPEYPEDLLKIVDMDAAQRTRLIEVLCRKWIEWKNEEFSELSVDAEILEVIRSGTFADNAELIESWAAQTDDLYLTELEQDAEPEVVMPLFHRARFADSLTYAKEAVNDDAAMDQLLYEYSYSRDEGIDEMMVAAVSEVLDGD